ncbi:MAG TPA: allophycocyanin [Thermosynechococcaceae cyanobacterium]
MLSQLQKLGRDVEGRYATDEELQFLQDYSSSYSLRLQTYQRLHELEATIVQQTYDRLRSREPGIFLSGTADVSAKWKRDTIRVLRYSAIALLLNDPETLRERLLYWMQTIMRAFSAQHSCHLTYEVMQAVVKQHLTPPEASLFCPILEVNRQLLGVV